MAATWGAFLAKCFWLLRITVQAMNYKSFSTVVNLGDLFEEALYVKGI